MQDLISTVTMQDIISTVKMQDIISTIMMQEIMDSNRNIEQGRKIFNGMKAIEKLVMT